MAKLPHVPFLHNHLDATEADTDDLFAVVSSFYQPDPSLDEQVQGDKAQAFLKLFTFNVAYLRGLSLDENQARFIVPLSFSGLYSDVNQPYYNPEAHVLVDESQPFTGEHARIQCLASAIATLYVDNDFSVDALNDFVFTTLLTNDKTDPNLIIQKAVMLPPEEAKQLLQRYLEANTNNQSHL